MRAGKWRSCHPGTAVITMSSDRRDRLPESAVVDATCSGRPNRPETFRRRRRLLLQMRTHRYPAPSPNSTHFWTTSGREPPNNGDHRRGCNSLRFAPLGQGLPRGGGKMHHHPLIFTLGAAVPSCCRCGRPPLAPPSELKSGRLERATMQETQTSAHPGANMVRRTKLSRVHTYKTQWVRARDFIASNAR